jgi:hypothetical protein
MMATFLFRCSFFKCTSQLICWCIYKVVFLRRKAPYRVPRHLAGRGLFSRMTAEQLETSTETFCKVSSYKVLLCWVPLCCSSSCWASWCWMSWRHFPYLLPSTSKVNIFFVFPSTTWVSSPILGSGYDLRNKRWDTRQGRHLKCKIFKEDLFQASQHDSCTRLPF